MKKFDYAKIPEYKFYKIIKNIFGPIIKVIFKVNFKGVENIPEKGGYILAVNHTSGLDPIIVALPKKLQPLHFMSKAELFKNPVLAWIMVHLYAFPVNRGKGDTSAIDYGCKVLEEGHVMAICPEGKRYKDKDGVPQRAKAGIALIANATGADVLPVAIHCKGAIKPFKRVTVSYGEIIKNEELKVQEGTHTEIRNAANYVMDKIVELWEEVNCK